MSRWSKIWQPTSWVIVHLDYHADGLRIVASLEKKGASKNEAQFEEFSTIVDVLKKFGKSRAYCLHVNGTGVLTRMVEFIPGYKEQLIVNGDKDDFYFCSYNDSFKVVTSFFRKNLIESILEELKEAKVFLVGISCGIIPVLLTADETEKISFDYAIDIEKGRIQSVQRNEAPTERSLIKSIFKTKNQAINEGILLSYLQPVENYSSGLIDEEQEEKLSDYSQFSQFKFFGILAVSVILSALMINYFYLNHVNNDVAQLEMELALNNENLSLLDRLKQEKTRKEQLVQTSGVSQNEFISFFIDKIGASVPKSVILREMYVFPLAENLKEKRKVEIRQDAIEIIGFTPNSQTLDDWMEKMNRFAWLKSVELLNYLKSTDSKAEFKLLISLAK